MTDGPRHSSSPSAALAMFDLDELLNCVHCGLCLPTCPTYQQTHLETYSPRGRIGLMKGAALGQVKIDEEFEKHMDACLGCRACETACPSGVKYGSLIETAREVVHETLGPKRKRPFMRRLAFDSLFMNSKQMKRAGRLVWLVQATGLQTFAQKSGIIRMFPQGMAQIQSVVGRLTSPSQRSQRQSVVPAETSDLTTGTPVYRIGMFTGCVMDQTFYEINQATARLLSKAGCEVIFFEAQECCGALHAHAGEKSGAKELAKKNIEAFEKSGLDLLVNNAGGCGLALKEYDHWFEDDPEWAERARQFVEKVKDISEILAELPPLSFSKKLNLKVTYQDSCHLAHGQGVRVQPRELIQSIPGVDYVEMKRADSCCGSAGIYNITNPDMSMQVLDDKMMDAKATSADLIVTSNPGCLLQMRLGIQRERIEQQVKAVHIVELLDMAL